MATKPAKQQAAQIERKKISDLRTDPSNANAGTERGLSMLDDSLSVVGIGRSIVTDKNGVIIAGNKTTERSIDRGFEDAIVVHTTGKELVVVQRDDLDLMSDEPNNPARQMAYYDNRVSSVDLQWNAEQLLADVNAGFDFAHLFTGDELAELLASVQEEPASDPGADIDRAAELQQKWQCERGQLWQIGKHRLLVGDSTNANDVARLMAGERADACISDPPYGINIVGSNGTAGNFPGTNAPRLQAVPIIGDDKPFDPSHLLDIADVIILWGGNHYADKLPPSSKWLVWDKKDGAFKESDLGDCELAWTNMNGAARLLHHTWQGMYRAGEGERSARLHPTQKPVDLMTWCIEQSSIEANAIVIDCYGGSGTTMVACEQLGRQCRMMELEPKYCAVILERMSLMGVSAELLQSETA